MARNSLSPQITARIIDHVRDSGMREGDHLPCQMLADAFKVSRAPVMSALRKLQEMRIVRSEPNRGYFLAVNGNEINDLEPVQSADEHADNRHYFQIAEDRLSGRLADRVTENELMRLYGVPRGRLVKILHRIADEGWIERLPGNGWEFRQTLTSRESYQQGYLFRAVLEKQAMLLPTFRVNKQGFAKARQAQQALLDGAYLSWSRSEIFGANNDFHEMLVACSQNEFFLDSIRRINRLRRLIEYRITTDRSRLPLQSREHLHILDLIESGDRLQAADFLYTHIMGAGRIKSPKLA